MNFSPHNYQSYAINYIETHPIAAVLLDMGLGKTVISLTAIADLLFDSFEAHRILVVAPLRVARDTWPAEIAKWEHLQHLTYAVCVGTPKERHMALLSGADITIINRENLGWLIDSSGFDFDYDMVIIDELSSFKNHKSKRFQALMKVRPKVKRIIGLTGTPSSNGLMDLWAEFKLLDFGERLGRFITHYRNNYFIPDKRNGEIIYSYKPMPYAEDPMCFMYQASALMDWLVTRRLPWLRMPSAFPSPQRNTALSFSQMELLPEACWNFLAPSRIQMPSAKAGTRVSPATILIRLPF